MSTLIEDRKERIKPMKADKYNILYVDDEEVNLRIFKYAFRRDYNVLTALNGEEALNAMKDNHVHLIITDQQMPKMTGVELLKKVVPKNPNVIRMIMTGFSDVAALIQAVNEIGINKYLKKPWDREMLKETLDAELSKSLMSEGITLSSSEGQNDALSAQKFVHGSLIKDEELIHEIFPKSYMVRKDSNAGSSDMYWIGEVAGKKIFCRADTYKVNSMSSALLAGIYAMIGDIAIDIDPDELTAELFYDRWEELLNDKLYTSYVKRTTERPIGILVMVQDESGVSIKSNAHFGSVIFADESVVPIVGNMDFASEEVDRVLVYSPRFSKINHKQTTFDKIVDESADLALVDQKRFINQELGFWLSENEIGNSLTIFALEP